jgi:hypothetical protein
VFDAAMILLHQVIQGQTGPVGKNTPLSKCAT